MYATPLTLIMHYIGEAQFNSLSFIPEQSYGVPPKSIFWKTEDFHVSRN